MRIAQINATYGYGSTGNIVRDLHQMVNAAGEESYVFWATRCINKEDEDSYIIRIGGFLDHKLHALLYRIFYNQGWNSRLETYRLCRKLKKLQIDIVHLHNLHSNYINLPILLEFLGKHKIKTVITLHDCWFFTGHCMHFMREKDCQQWVSEECINCPVFRTKPRLQKQIHGQFIEKQCLYNALNRLEFVGVSEWIADCGSRSILGSAGSCSRIYNWIDTELFYPRNNTDIVRRKYGIPEDKALILGVSQGWSIRKGILEFQRICEALSDRATVVLVGEHGDLESTPDLKFIGYANSPEDLADLYSAADVFVNPSHMETFGKVTAEALASGTPVVAYDNTGTSELVNDSTGQLVEDGNMEQLLMAVEAVLRKGKAAYGQSCREYALSNFKKDIQLQEYMRLYHKLNCPI